MRAHLVQFDIVWEDHAANFAKVDGLLARAGVGPGDLVALPEMFSTGFSLDTEVTADHGGVVLEYVRGLATRLGCWVQGGRTVLETGSTHATNEAPVVDPSGRLVCSYRKIHPFSYGHEPERFVGGDEVMVYRWGESRGKDEQGSVTVPRAAQSWHISGADVGSTTVPRATQSWHSGGSLTVCPATCYDLRFPELFRRGLAMGAECYAIGACWPRARQAHWRALLVARAIENQAFVLGVNRTGRDPTLEYAGGSIALSPKGEVLGELRDEEAVLSVEVDVGVLREWRRVFPAWRDGKIERVK